MAGWGWKVLRWAVDAGVSPEAQTSQDRRAKRECEGERLRGNQDESTDS